MVINPLDLLKILNTMDTVVILLQAGILTIFATALAELARIRGARRAAACTALLAGTGFAVELAGVATGLIFGQYRYSGPTLLGVHILMPIAWTAVIAPIYSLAPGRGPAKPVSTALLAALFDATVDPVASTLYHVWAWNCRGACFYGVPPENFAGWLLTALLMAFLMQKTVGYVKLRLSEALLIAFTAAHVALGANALGTTWLLTALAATAAMATLHIKNLKEKTGSRGRPPAPQAS